VGLLYTLSYVCVVAGRQGITTIAGGCLATRMRRLGGTVPGRPDYPFLVFVVLGSKVNHLALTASIRLVAFASRFMLRVVVSVVVFTIQDARTRFSETLHLASYALAQLGI
jgi:hypothetical protein